MNVIAVEGLSKTYRLGFKGKTQMALENLDLEVNEGEIFGFLGPNGAGKTTTLKILLGLMMPTSGRAMLFGKKVGDKQVKQWIGFLPESPYFCDYLVADEFLRYYGKLFGLKNKELDHQIEKLLKLVGLESYRHLQMRKFSKGMLQRIGIAQALINDPQLVILDEPMSGLDPVGRKEMRDLIIQLKQQGKTVFFSSHIIPDVEVLCDRVGILVKGRLQKVGKLNEILEARIKYIEVVVKELNNQAENSLKAFSQSVIRTGDHVIIRIGNEDYLQEVLALLQMLKGKLISILPVRETLEEYFIQETQKGSNDGN